MNQITDPLIRNEAQRVFEMLKDLPLYLKAYTHEIDVDAREHDLSLFTQFSGGLTLLSEELLDLNDATFFDTNARLLLIDRYTQYTRDALGFVVSRARLPGEQRLAEIF